MFPKSAALAAFVALVFLAPAAGAQEVQHTGPLSEVRALIRRSQYRASRLHLAALPAVVVGGPHSGTLVLGGRADYHPTDDLALGMWGARGWRARDAPGPGWAGAGQVTVVPAHGKLALLGETIVRIDVFAFGGIGAVAQAGQARLGPTFGGGLVLYLGEAGGLTAEARAISSTVLVSLGLVLALPFEARYECVLGGA